MHRTEDDAPAAFFADALLPLRQANRQRDVRYFPRHPDAAADSYWAAPITRSGGVERVGFGDGSGAALLERLRDHWLAQGEASLPMLHAEIEALRQHLCEPGVADTTDDGQLSYSAYPLF